MARSGELQSAPLALVVKETQAKAVPVAKPSRTSEAQPVAPSILKEQSKAIILTHIDRAKTFREQGNYAGALAELEKAKAIDASNGDIGMEIEQTRRACNAERILGNKPAC